MIVDICLRVSLCGGFFAFNIHQRWPPVHRLTFHLPVEQFFVLNYKENIGDVLERNKDKKTMFQVWMEANCKYYEGMNLT